MAPTVLLIRHAEALHNVFPEAHHTRDPELTYLGTTQCGNLRKHLQQDLPLAEQIELIVVSPLRRTIQTALYALSWLVARGVPVVARAEWQENSNKPCDTGSEPSVISQEFPNVDLSLLDPVYPSKTDLYGFNQRSILRRGIEARRWLAQRPEKVIAVVSHSVFLRSSVANAWFMNADYRIFDFASKIDREAKLIEWGWTARRGGGMARSLIGAVEVKPSNFGER